ncbi:phage tail tape measure protein, partial [Virgibacillus chiguensis]
MERIEGMSIALDLETLRLERGLTGLKDQLKTVNSEMKANMSAFDRGDQTVEKYETRLRGLNKKLETQKAVTKAAKAEYEKMVSEYGEGSKEAEKAAREYNHQAAALNNLDRYVSNAREELEKLRKQQDLSNSRWGKFTSNLDQASDRMKSTGEKFTNLGSSLSTSVTTPILALGAGSLLTAKNFESSSVRMQNSLGLTAKEAKSLTKISRDIYKKGFGNSFEEVDNALLQTKQNIQGLNQAELGKITKKALVLSETFNSDVNEVTRAGNNLIKGFGIEADKAFDLMASGAQNGLNFSNEMFDNLSEYAPLFGKMGYSAEEYFQMLIQGSKAGVYNLDFINDAMKEFQVRLKDGSKSTSDAMGEMSKSTQDVWKAFLNGDKTVKDVSNTVLKELEGMDDQVKANEIGVALFGTKWEDLEADAMYALGGIDGNLKGVNGTMDKMSKNMEKTFNQRVKKVWRDLQSALLPIGEVLLDIAEDALPKVSKAIQDATKWFSNLSPEIQKAIVATGGLASAMGPLMLVFGGAFRTIGMFTGGLSKTIKFFGRMGKGSKDAGKSLQTFDGVSKKSGTEALKTSGKFGKVVGSLGRVGKIAGIARLGLSALGGPMGILASIAIPALIKGGIGLVNHLKEDSIPAVEGFGDKVSDSTTKAVLGYEKLNNEATTQLNQLFWSGQEITEEGSQKLIQTFSSMTNQISTNMKTKFDESYQSMSNFFANSKALSDQEEQAILLKMQESHLKRQEEVQKNQDRIKEILNTASQEKRSLTKSEKTEINQIQDSMRKTAVQTMSKSQIEQEAIMTELKNNSRNITARQAADTVKNSKKAKDGSVKEANKKFNEVRNWAVYERDVTGNLSKEEADKIIKDARNTKNETIKKAKEKHRGVVDQARKQAKGHAKEVNWTRGTVLTNWDKLVIGVAEAMGNITDGVNWVLGKIGLKHLKIPKWFPKTMTKALMGYEKGTSRHGHPGGHAIVGEKGRELAYIPGQGITMLGETGPQFLDLPKGTSVLPNKHTENLLKSYGFPGYESGIGNFFDMALSSPKKLVNKVWSKFLGKLPSFGGTFKDLFKGTVSYAKKGAGSYIKNKIKDFFSFGEDVKGKVNGSLSKWINAAIKIAGVPQSWFKPLTTIAVKESGGNPRAVNRWDINAKRGIPSMGLMQTIMPTFQAHKKRGLDNILNPIHNAVAAINYIKSRYGNVFNVPGIKAMRRGGKYVGYKTGGLVKNKGLYELAEDGWPEYVIPTNPSRRTEAMKLLALAGKDIQRNKQGNKRPSQLSDATISNDNKDYTKDLLDATLEQNNILMQILAKDNNVYLD